MDEEEIVRVGREAFLAWCVLMTGVLIYEALAPEGQLLSEGMDRACVKHPLATRMVIVVLSLHLTGWLPDKFDPLHIMAGKREVIRRARPRQKPKHEYAEPHPSMS